MDRPYSVAHAARLLASHLQLTGRELLPRAAGESDADLAQRLYEAPFVVLAHDTASDPGFNYANRAAQRLFERDWAGLVGLPSRLSAEAPERGERERLLARVRDQGYIDDYSGVRISKSGRRFRIRRATVWSVTGADGRPAGQAATFSDWQALDDPPAIEIRDTDPRTPDVRRLLALSDSCMGSLYPAESNHLEPAEELCADHVIFVGAFERDTLVACGAARVMADDGLYGEIKRVYVVEERRGRGISRRIMDVLERRLAARGVQVARLETGIRQPAALALYERLGYEYRPPFGSYRLDPLSVFMEKRLPPAD
jgi:putative acetyltransferase